MKTWRRWYVDQAWRVFYLSNTWIYWSLHIWA